MHCSINLEDLENGEIALQVVHTNGYSEKSNAHKLSVQIIKWLDEQAESKKEIAHAGN